MSKVAVWDSRVDVVGKRSETLLSGGPRCVYKRAGCLSCPTTPIFDLTPFPIAMHHAPFSLLLHALGVATATDAGGAL